MTTTPKIPNLDEVLAIAQRIHNGSTVDVQASDAFALARDFLELFGEAQPCGLIEPEVYPGEVIVTREMVGRYSPREALAAAVAIIRGAIQAQEQP